MRAGEYPALLIEARQDGGAPAGGRQCVEASIERYMAALATIASAAPLLGFLGTVVGMIEIFGAHTAANNQPALLAHGTSVALYNTAFGLIVAIPALVFWRYFRSVVDRHVVAMEVAAEHFVRHLSRAGS